LHVEQGYSRKFLFAGTLLLKWPNFVHKILLILQADLPERSVINNICRSAVPVQKYLPERRCATFRHHFANDVEITEPDQKTKENAFYYQLNDDGRGAD